MKSRLDSRTECAPERLPRGRSPLVDSGRMCERVTRERVPLNWTAGLEPQESRLALEPWRAYGLLEAAVEEAAAALNVDRTQSAKLAEIQREVLESVHAGALATLRLIDALRMNSGVVRVADVRIERHSRHIIALNEQAIGFFDAARDLIGLFAASEREPCGMRPRAAAGRRIWRQPELHEDRLRQLTFQQLRVLELLLDGLPNKLIAHELGVCETTVKAHVSKVLRKLKVHSRARAIAMIANDDRARP